MLIKAAEVECRGPTTRSGLRHPIIPAYMDDMTITTISIIGARWLLKGIEKLIILARMSFNATVEVSCVKKVKLSDDRFKFSGKYIPTIKNKPVKSLGEWFDHILKETRDRLESWLNKIDRSGLPGSFKAWIYQHVVLPKILWPLSIYEFTSYNVKQLEKRINSRLRRWLGLPKCLSSVVLYGNSNMVQQPFKSLVEEYKVAKVRSIIQFKFSKDLKIAGAGIEVSTGKKWKTAKELKIAEERLREKEILRVVATGRAGLGVFLSIRIDKIAGKEKQKLLQGEIRKGEEENRMGEMVGLRQQGA